MNRVDTISQAASITDSPDSVYLAEQARSWASAYVHLPFCARLCPYCDFAVVTGRDQLIDRYAAALVAEIGTEEEWRPLSSIYLGGGTPSRVPADLLGGVLRTLAGRFSLEDGAEISLEANPEDFDHEVASGLAEVGFERVSLGAQSFDTRVLASLGRRHLPIDIARAVEAARAAGFRSINLDLILGTPGESVDSWETTLTRALELGPDHVSCYALTVEPGTELGRAVAAGANAPDPDTQADFYELACGRLADAGLIRYEVSNWARPGHTVRYNLAVWAQAPYLAFGLGAHRFRDRVRSHNLRRFDGYLTAIEQGASPRAGSEIVQGWAAEQERVFLGIRRVAGVFLGEAGNRLLADEDGQRLAEAGVIGVKADRLRVEKPLLTDRVARAVLALEPPEC